MYFLPSTHRCQRPNALTSLERWIRSPQTHLLYSMDSATVVLGLKAAKLPAECSSLPSSKLNHILHVEDVQENLSPQPYVQTSAQCSISVHELEFQKESSQGEQDGRGTSKVKHQTQSILVGPTEMISSIFFLAFQSLQQSKEPKKPD